MQNPGTTDPSRELRADERAVLQKLLSVDFPGVGELRLQIPHTRVRDECGCGCPSVVFTVDKTAAPPAAVETNIPVEGFVRPGRKTAVSAMLFVWEGYLHELEVMGRRDGFPKHMPDAESLELYIES